ncbi:MAG: histidine kinase, partial [Actinobacteria bacterium]|nr:histidine kinase [Actinomycetota bacterium]
MKFRRQEVEPLETQEILPQVLLKSLQSLESESLIVIPGEQILFQSPGISNFAILKDERIISEDLMALIRVARRTNETHRSRIEIARGPIGAGKREFEVSVS